MINTDVVTQIDVNDNKIEIIRVGDIDYISLTDLARYADNDDPRYPIQNWMRNKDVILFLGLWENMHNEDFKRVEFDAFKNDSASQSFTMSPSRWINTLEEFFTIGNSKASIHEWNMAQIDEEYKQKAKEEKSLKKIRRKEINKKR